ncbi:cyanophycinase [Oxalobacteraceae bacterium OM1]|nr:cyanophycinase [Oxalobacteraceae bacterium OM1]
MQPWMKWFCAALTIVSAGTGATEPPKGSLVIAGGGVRVENTVVWERIVQLAGGKGARIAVLPSASGNPGRAGQHAVDMLNKAGAQAFVVPVSVKLDAPEYRQAVADPDLVEQVRAAGGVYFTGGDQRRITRALRAEDGSNTPLLDAVWDIYRKGGVIAGTSAGAAIMSTTMFYEPKAVLPTLKFGVRDGKEIAAGLGFIGPDVFVDQHLLIRGRFARMLPVMLHKHYKLGLGVDENTAMVVTGGRHLEVIGYKGVLVVDVSEASTDRKLKHFNVKNAKLSYLDRGDRFDLVTRAFTPAKQKEGGRVDASKPSFNAPRYFTDILANSTVVDLMQDFIDNKQTEVIGLAFGDPASDMPELGFEFRFSKGPDSAGYFTSAFGGEDYSVLNIRLDVRPIRMQVPLYRYEE